MARDEVGFRGQAPHEVFQAYMEAIVCDPAYEGMPDAHYDDGRIQWEAPSNRTGGKFKDSHQRRRDWWTQKATSLGINSLEGKWISRVAKLIHPTMRKPCKSCGREMDIRYVYPSTALVARIRKLGVREDDFEIIPTEDIFSIVRRLREQYSDTIMLEFPRLLKGSNHPKNGSDLDEWLAWLEADFVPSEPKALSPGAMSNAPDRFDGFHSFNRCCRSKADTGRTASNLRTYSTDRRVFEYWASGDWIAADHLMGILRRDFRDESCLNGHPGPCQADHIGPISLGFDHQPHFKLLCGACNSAKNNRMTLSDIDWLIEREKLGENVISWHSKQTWDSCKSKIATSEQALRVSKILRDNRHSYMAALAEIAEQGHFAFLASLLELGYADFDVEFEGLSVKNHITFWEKIHHARRNNKYAIEQKARRSRIAFGELLFYFSKGNRNAYVVKCEDSAANLAKALDELASISAYSGPLDRAIATSLKAEAGEVDGQFRLVYQTFANFDFGPFANARKALEDHMNSVGTKLASMWNDDRFTRELLEGQTAGKAEFPSE